MAQKALKRWAADPRVSEAYRDTDGYWVYTKPGFCSDPETHTIHGNSVKEIQSRLRCIRPCACDECIHELASMKSPVAQELHCGSCLNKVRWLTQVDGEWVGPCCVPKEVWSRYPGWFKAEELSQKRSALAKKNLHKATV